MNNKRVFAALLILLLALSFLPSIAASAVSVSSAQLEGYINSAVLARKTNDGLTGGSILGSDRFINAENGGSSAASSTWSDWLAFAMGRYSIVYADGSIDFKFNDGNGYNKYLSAMKDYITKTYATNNGMLNSSKSTEWQRAALTVTALGGDPTSFGTYNGSPINLIADGSYNCVVKNGPARQGINGVIFALISKNTKDFTQPSQVLYSDEYLITYILKQQLADGENGSSGGWALSGSASDPDITAMAIQALSRYYSSVQTYTYTNSKTKTELTKTVRQAVDEGLARLSSLQLADGDFSSWGTVNVESTAQVMVALTELGIDPLTDSRFIKNGNTLLDGILKYRMSDGGFSHSFQTDPNNPYAQAGKYNYMATDQACYALVAYWRYVNGLNPLYNCRADRSGTVPVTDFPSTTATHSEADIPTQNDNTTDNASQEVTWVHKETTTTGDITTTVISDATTHYSHTSENTTVQSTSSQQQNTVNASESGGIIAATTAETSAEIPKTGGTHRADALTLIVALLSCVVILTTKKKEHA